MKVAALPTLQEGRKESAETPWDPHEPSKGTGGTAPAHACRSLPCLPSGPCTSTSHSAPG